MKKTLGLFAFVLTSVLASAVCAIAEEPLSSSVKSDPMQLKNSNVCMMNNQYMGSEQTPVPVEGKTYYGCCKSCAANLEKNVALRSAKDPYSGELVDKVDAFIVLKPGSAKDVLYFKSKENYQNWLTLQANALNMSIQPEEQSK